MTWKCVKPGIQLVNLCLCLFQGLECEQFARIDWILDIDRRAECMAQVADLVDDTLGHRAAIAAESDRLHTVALTHAAFR